MASGEDQIFTKRGRRARFYGEKKVPRVMLQEQGSCCATTRSVVEFEPGRWLIGGG